MLKKFKMFNKKLTTDAFTNLISAETLIDGIITFSGIIKIQGRVKGEMINYHTANQGSDADCIIVDEGGSVESDSMISFNIVIGGVVTSKKIWAESTVRILASATIRDASIYYRNLEIEPGAKLINCQMKHLDYCSEGEQI